MARLSNAVAARRRRRGWSQEELARRAGLSRAEISAIENGRLVPSTAAALALAASLECRVEAIFSLAVSPLTQTQWAWMPRHLPARFWKASVANRTLLYPAEATAVGTLSPDGVAVADQLELRQPADPERTLVIAGCDPAVSLLVLELVGSSHLRLLPLIRSSCQALELLKQGLVHAAGVHLSNSNQPSANERVVRDLLGPSYRLLHLARWQEGVAVTPSVKARSIRQTLNSGLHWVNREEGSGARRCLDRLLGSRKPKPRGYHRFAADHRGVAEAIRSGWAQAGVCVRLPAEEAGLDFLPVQEEDYELCFPESAEADARIKGLIRTVRAASFRRTFKELPGYDVSRTGEVRAVSGF